MPPGRQAPVGRLAERLGMPQRFLAQQITVLAKAGIVTCRRGTGGGCALGRPAASITAAEIVRALERDVIDVPHARGSAAAEMWADIERTVEGQLESVTLAALAHRQAELDRPDADTYQI